MEIEVIHYKGWANSLRLSNNEVDLVVVTAIGPRVMRYGFIDKENIFVELSQTLGKTGGDTWHVYGGHRLSHAPQADPRSHYPDNVPVEYLQRDNFLRLTQPVEETNGIQKELDISLGPHSTKVTVVHRLYNHNLWPVKLSPWALSALRTGGQAVAPLPPRGTHHDELQPTGCISLWAYADMSDPCWRWGREYVFLRQDRDKQDPQKAGFWVPAGWAAYQWNEMLFLKEVKIQSGEDYPDKNVNVEFYTDHSLLEMETLGPLTTIEPGAYIEHVEKWSLHRGVAILKDENIVNQTIIPLLSIQQGD